MNLQGTLHGISYSRSKAEVISIELNCTEPVDIDSLIGQTLAITVDESGIREKKGFKPVIDFIKRKEDNMNKAFIKGRFADNPELRKTPTGKSVVSFTLGVDNGETQPTSWVSCVAWEKIAEQICQYFLKGDEITVIGKILTRTNEYMNKKSKITEIQVEEWEFGRKKNRETSFPNPFEQEVQNIEEEVSI